MTVTLDIARSFVKADGDDDDAIKMMMSSARSICEGYCNRKFYDDDEAQATDFSVALADWATASSAMNGQISAATDPGLNALITDHYIHVFAEIKKRTNGVVIDGSIDAAMLMTIGHLYFNREDNVVSGNNAVQLPVGAQRILQPYLWIGDLAGSSFPCGS